MDSFASGYRPVAGSRGHSNIRSGSIKGGQRPVAFSERLCSRVGYSRFKVQSNNTCRTESTDCHLLYKETGPVSDGCNITSNKYSTARIITYRTSIHRHSCT
jgi:hypothetical protein